MVTLDGNATMTYEVQSSSAPSIFTGIFSAFMKLAYALPFTILGFSLVVTPIGLTQTHLFSSLEGFQC